MWPDTNHCYCVAVSWEIFRCDVDCAAEPSRCINAALCASRRRPAPVATLTHRLGTLNSFASDEAHGEALANDGFLAAGYDTVHVDDCWPERQRNAAGQLVANATRFPGGMASLGTALHAKNVKFGLYTAESPSMILTPS